MKYHRSYKDRLQKKKKGNAIKVGRRGEARAKFKKSDKARTPGDKITAYKYLEGNNVIEGKGLFIVSEMI